MVFDDLGRFSVILQFYMSKILGTCVFRWVGWHPEFLLEGLLQVLLVCVGFDQPYAAKFFEHVMVWVGKFFACAGCTAPEHCLNVSDNALLGFTIESPAITRSEDPHIFV